MSSIRAAIASCQNSFRRPLWTIVVKRSGRACLPTSRVASPNRGAHRHFLPMPSDRPCFAPQFFLGSRCSKYRAHPNGRPIVADQWGYDLPLLGSEYQGWHVDYRRPLFPVAPDLPLPIYMVVVNFGLVPIGQEHGPIEIAPGTHRISRLERDKAIETGGISAEPIRLEIGDVLIRHPWALLAARPTPLASATRGAGMPTRAVTWRTCLEQHGSL